MGIKFSSFNGTNKTKDNYKKLWDYYLEICRVACVKPNMTYQEFEQNTTISQVENMNRYFNL